MKQKMITGFAAVTVIIAMSSFSFLSYVNRRIPGDLLKQLGITEPALKSNISNSFFSGYLNYYSANNVKNIAAGDKEAITTDMLNYVKQHVSSAAFQKDYQQYRNREKGKIYPVTPLVTKDELTKKKIAEAEATLKTFQDLLKTTTDAAVIKSHKEQIDYWNKAITDYRSGNSEQIKYELMMAENRYKTEKENYDQLMKQWETAYPETAEQFIKQRLNDFLAATKDIDYKAALADRNGKKVFVNPVYEGKNKKWKMGFRAGKEVTETARSFAQQWVKSLYPL